MIFFISSLQATNRSKSCRGKQALSKKRLQALNQIYQINQQIHFKETKTWWKLKNFLQNQIDFLSYSGPIRFSANSFGNPEISFFSPGSVINLYIIRYWWSGRSCSNHWGRFGGPAENPSTIDRRPNRMYRDSWPSAVKNIKPKMIAIAKTETVAIVKNNFFLLSTSWNWFKIELKEKITKSRMRFKFDFEICVKKHDKVTKSTTGLLLVGWNRFLNAFVQSWFESS